MALKLTCEFGFDGVNQNTAHATTDSIVTATLSGMGMFAWPAVTPGNPNYPLLHNVKSFEAVVVVDPDVLEPLDVLPHYQTDDWSWQIDVDKINGIISVKASGPNVLLGLTKVNLAQITFRMKGQIGQTSHVAVASGKLGLDNASVSSIRVPVETPAPYTVGFGSVQIPAGQTVTVPYMLSAMSGTPAATQRWPYYGINLAIDINTKVAAITAARLVMPVDGKYLVNPPAKFFFGMNPNGGSTIVNQSFASSDPPSGPTKLAPLVLTPGPIFELDIKAVGLAGRKTALNIMSGNLQPFEAWLPCNRIDGLIEVV